MNREEILRYWLVLFFLSVLFISMAGAATQNQDQSGSQSYVIQDSAELISLLKMHIAYVGKTQQARMDGVIMYIDRISGGTGGGRPATDRGRLSDRRFSGACDAHG
jgi:hypothetical protein